MATYIDREDTYFFSSNDELTTLAGEPVNKDLEGSRFQVRMEPPISVPKEAEGVFIECPSANILHVTPNIASEYQNNTLYLEYTYEDGGPQTLSLTLVVPDGNYTIDTLNAQFQVQLASFDIPPDNTLKFSPGALIFTASDATQRISVTVAEGLSLLTNPLLANNVMPTLGFSTPVLGQPYGDLVSTYDGQTFEAPNSAQLNRVNAYLLHSDLIQGGIPFNSQQDNIFAEVPIDVPAGGLIAYRPFNPFKVSGEHLKHGSKDLLTFFLTDEQNRAVNTLGENFDFSIVIKYKMPVR
jgi:hypothetical protein